VGAAPGVVGTAVNPAEHEQTLERVRQFLREHGATDAEIAAAEAGDVLDLLVADRLLVPAERRYTVHEVSEITGMPVELARRFWRALGFADVGEQERAFTDLDIEAILIFQAMVHLGVVEVEAAVQLARVIGSSMARIADAEVSPAVLTGMPGTSSSGDSVEAADRFARSAGSSLPAMARLLEFVWRRHVQAATRRAMLLRTRGANGALPHLAVGFADMVGFTVLSQQLAEDELAALVSRFEEVAHDTVTAMGGRVVKMIGDEAMFVTESVLAAARIGLRLSEVYADDELLSDVRVALAVGPVLVQDGDYFGPVVNLASRMVGIANPGSVLVSDEFHTALVQELHPAGGSSPGAAGIPGGLVLPGLPVPGGSGTAASAAPGHGELGFKALRPRHLKDFGRVQLWALVRPGDDAARLERRMGRRWERLAEVLREIDELRERGERLIASGRQVVEQGRMVVEAMSGSESAETTARDQLPSSTHEAPPQGPTADDQGTSGTGQPPGVDQVPQVPSGVGQPNGGDAEGPQREAAVDRSEGPAA